MARKKGLGRGLDALLGTSAAPAASDSGLLEVPVNLIERGRFQPRTRFAPEALEELSQSIRSRGVVQPIVVRPLSGGRFELVAGERRWRACQMAGLATVPAVVREIDDHEALAVALIENVQREDLNPVEEALALARLIEEFGLTHQEAADAVARSRAAVTNLLRLLELEPDVRERLENGEFGMGHARALLGLSGAAQSRAANEVARRQLSARDTEALVRRAKADPTPRPKPKTDPDITRLENELGDALGAPVRLEHGRGGKGRMVITYTSLDELDGVLNKLRPAER